MEWLPNWPKLLNVYEPCAVIAVKRSQVINMGLYMCRYHGTIMVRRHKAAGRRVAPDGPRDARPSPWPPAGIRPFHDER